MRTIELMKRGIAVGVVSSAIACQASETKPSTTVAPTASPPKVIAPSIKGALTSASTKELWTNGGVVYLEDAPKEVGVAMTATVEMRKREFVPEIAVITNGGSVSFTNREALTHHVFSPDIPNWNTGYLKKDDTIDRRFDNPGSYGLLCNIHTEMVGYVLVIPSTYFGRVTPGGEYAIGNVPAGTYQVTAWAPRTKPVTQSVTVGASGPTTVNFELR